MIWGQKDTAVNKMNQRSSPPSHPIQGHSSQDIDSLHQRAVSLSLGSNPQPTKLGNDKHSQVGKQDPTAAGFLLGSNFNSSQKKFPV